MNHKLRLLTTVLFLATIVACKSSKTTVSNEEKGIKWLTYEQMLIAQKSKPKKVIFDVYTDWCGWCKVMDKNTFSHKEIGKYVNKNFYAVKLDAEGDEKVLYNGNVMTSTELARSWGIGGYPTTVYTDEKLNLIVAPLSGYLDTTQFNKVVHFFGEEAYKTQSFDKYTFND